jgi:predicted TIM-barrel fold metal-dependent hydrolase
MTTSTIDVHAHHLPTALGERFTELSGVSYGLRHSDDHSRRIADLDEAGVDEQILGLGAVQPYWPNAAASLAGARAANDLYADIASGNGGRFRAFGAVPLPHAEEAAGEAVRCLDELGFAGIGLGCSALGVPLDDDRLAPFWAELDSRGAIAYLHPGVANDGLVGVSEYPMLLGPVFGSPAEQSVAVARLALRGTFGKYPNVRFVVCGMGGNLLVAASKLADSLVRGKLHDENHDADAIIDLFTSRVWYDTSSIDPVLALAAREAQAIDRLVFGSDSPWGCAVKAMGALRSVLDPDEVAAVLARGASLL